MPKVSDRTAPVTVLLPVHNGGRHLPAAVSSILGQTYRDFELLVIDDGSTDGTSDYLKSVDDPRLRVHHQPNLGLVSALNTGLSMARHEFVARMDADDVSEPDRIQVQVDHLLDHPSVAAVGCCYTVIDEQDAVLREVHTAGHPDYLAAQLYFRNVLPHAGMMFRRSLVLAAGGYRDVGPVEDYDLWARLTADHAIASVPLLLLRYRLTSTGISLGARDLQRRCHREIRDRLHRERPLTVPPARVVVARGLDHGRDFAASCAGADRAFVFDHVWLAALLARRRRTGAATRVALGVLGLILRRPARAMGLLDVVRGQLVARRHR